MKRWITDSLFVECQQSAVRHANNHWFCTNLWDITANLEKLWTLAVNWKHIWMCVNISQHKSTKYVVVCIPLWREVISHCEHDAPFSDSFWVDFRVKSLQTANSIIFSSPLLLNINQIFTQFICYTLNRECNQVSHSSLVI